MANRLRSTLAGVILGLLAAAMLMTPATPAHAATITVGNGISTTDLSAVGMSPTTLATDLAGTGVTVSNVVYHGASAQAGRIHVVDPAVVSFNDGIILSSGNIADIVGPNKSDGITGDMAGPADADLNALIANTKTVNPVTFDAASLEFDFVPQADHVFFTYTFGSDEYLEWVNLFNDVFAFYVNGTNCATVPSGDTVSIDTINDAINPNLFRDNSFSAPPAQPINIESDGLSVEMVCSAAVKPGQTNHMKLAIADTSDQILDSVVMLKTDSLSTVKPESCNDGVDNDDDLLVDMQDSSCTTTTKPAPKGSSGIGTGGNEPPFTGNEGTPVLLDAAAMGWKPTSDTVNTSWQVHGINGTVGDCTVDPGNALPVVGGAIAPATAICPHEGEYVARIDGWDVEHKSAFDYDVDFFVHNAPPAVTIDSPLNGTVVGVGAPVDVVASVSDPGNGDQVSCVINWGDGTNGPGVVSSGTCTGHHAYSSPGSQLVSVKATDNTGASSAAALVVQVDAGPTVPATPAAPVATPASTSAKLTWTAPGDGGAAIDGYAVEVAKASDGVFAPATGCASVPASTTACLAKGLVNGTGYIFRLKAHNVAGWSGYSPASAVVVPRTIPGGVSSLVATSPGAAAISATWTAPTKDGGAAIDKYLVRAYLNGTVASKYCYATTTSGCPLTGLPAGTYTVFVRAHNAAGWGPTVASNSVTVVTRPSAPINPVATSSAKGAASATWSAPASDGGQTIDKYVARAYLNGTTGSKYCYATTTAGCTITGLTPGSYTVRVQAHNASGWSTQAVTGAFAVQ